MRQVRTKWSPIAWIFGSQLPQPEALVCPYCNGTDWYEGSKGGMSINIMCANPQCEHWFNWYQGIRPMDDLHKAGKNPRDQL